MFCAACSQVLVLLAASIFALFTKYFVLYFHRMLAAIVFIVSFVVYGIVGVTPETENVCNKVNVFFLTVKVWYQDTYRWYFSFVNSFRQNVDNKTYVIIGGH